MTALRVGELIDMMSYHSNSIPCVPSFYGCINRHDVIPLVTAYPVLMPMGECAPKWPGFHGMSTANDALQSIYAYMIGLCIHDRIS